MKNNEYQECTECKYFGGGYCLDICPIEPRIDKLEDKFYKLLKGDQK